MDIQIMQTDTGLWVGIVITQLGIFEVTDPYPNKWQVEDDIKNGFINTSMFQ